MFALNKNIHFTEVTLTILELPCLPYIFIYLQDSSNFEFIVHRSIWFDTQKRFQAYLALNDLCFI